MLIGVKSKIRNGKEFANKMYLRDTQTELRRYIYYMTSQSLSHAQSFNIIWELSETAKANIFPIRPENIFRTVS
jgi:hypothetical protein